MPVDNDAQASPFMATGRCFGHPLYVTHSTPQATSAALPRAPVRTGAMVDPHLSVLWLENCQGSFQVGFGGDLEVVVGVLNYFHGIAESFDKD